MFRVEIQEVVITEAGNGPRKYKVADVVYSWNGNNRKQRIMSFANPDVFKTVTGLSTPVSVEVETAKNAKGYDEWAKVVVASGAATSAPAAKAVAGKVLGSNYETSEERAKRQLMIVRQSSISNSIELMKHNNPSKQVDEDVMLALAQKLVDFVYGTDETLETLDRMPSDIPE